VSFPTDQPSCIVHVPLNVYIISVKFIVVSRIQEHVHVITSFTFGLNLCTTGDTAIFLPNVKQINCTREIRRTRRV